MPGLLRGVARVAVVSGTATAVSNRVSRRQAGRWASQDEGAYQEPQQAPPPPVDDGPDMLTQLRELGQLKDEGVLTDQEFSDQKAKILAAQ